MGVRTRPCLDGRLFMVSMQSPLPVLALLFNTLVWGLAWWPFRAMHEAGLHPLWATALMYALVLVSLVLLRPASLRQALQYQPCCCWAPARAATTSPSTGP